MSAQMEHVGSAHFKVEGCEDRKRSVFTDECHYSTNFLPEEEVIGNSFQTFLFEFWRWLPHMPRHSEGTFRGMVKCLAISTTIALNAVRKEKSYVKVLQCWQKGRIHLLCEVYCPTAGIKTLERRV
ncbi:hypothetical protein AVEN_38116-1 [Araneus ventricosus]|uniref:Uncharacterized protein n=1 Tax=Araneus ventricosus TaxID=182803 RepID=A0A4Y2LMI0_ARAVE|nr:hypothetical protein AVEN_38116-1 [Araneus ventricosus]